MLEEVHSNYMFSCPSQAPSIKLHDEAMTKRKKAKKKDVSLALSTLLPTITATTALSTKWDGNASCHCCA